MSVLLFVPFEKVLVRQFHSASGAGETGGVESLAESCHDSGGVTNFDFVFAKDHYSHQ